jgi:NADH-ubiquinone oxidoreductase chain 1
LSLFFVILQGLAYSLSLGLKSCILIFVFIWVRASFPRIRFDQLMSYCWTILLPIVIGFIILIPCIVYNLSLMPSNFYLI